MQLKFKNDDLSTFQLTKHFLATLLQIHSRIAKWKKLLESSSWIPKVYLILREWKKFGKDSYIYHVLLLCVVHSLTFASLCFTHHVWIPQFQVIICQCAKHEWMSFLYRIPKTEPYFLFCGLELNLFLCLQHLVLAPNFSWPPHFWNVHLLMDRINVNIPLLRGAQDYPA